MKRSDRATSGSSEAKKAKEVSLISTKELCLPSEEPENEKRFDRSVDSISQLPQDILVFILSLLPLKEAARTSTLSHRWRCLWSYIPCLNFDAQEKLLDLQLTEKNLESEGRHYVKWVNRVIDSYKGFNLEALRIRFSLDSRFQYDVDKWVQFAIQWNLKMFELNLSDSYDSGKYSPCSFPQLSGGPMEHFPRAMFSNSSSLTSLKLIAVNVGGEALECFLTNCPLLDVLCVKYSHCLVSLRVIGASLKLRQLEVCMCNYLESLEISAPNIESFKYVGPWLSMPLKHTPKLLETYFGSEFGVEIIDNFFLLSSYSSQLQKLVLDLEVDFMENKGFRKWPTLANLKELELIVIAEGHCSLIGFTSLIKASPCLLKFTLKLDYLDMFEQRALRKVRKFPHQHIKVVELAGFVGKPIDLELVQYFYKNAVALEEIVFDTRKPKYMGTIFEKKQNAETLEGRECANNLRSDLFSGVKYDQDYHPGRRKRGKDYKEGMYELPFYYPGQICEGKVTTLHLYQGAFVDIGGVYDGWVPIKGNDWYWIRHHIKVGMPVIVEILAKRDPYRFRFPIEMRFVHPNIDHLIFNRFDYPPIFHRDEDSNPDEVRRDCGRPPIPRKDPGIKPEDEALLSNHPYVDKLWQIHVAEQMILDDLELNPDKYRDKRLSELSDEEDFDEENNIEYTKVRYKNSLLPKKILKTSVKELDLEAAFSERQVHNKLKQEAQDRGEEYKITKLRRNIEMDEYDLMHWRRSFEEREALIRDISCRQALGLPLEEPGRYVDATYFGKDQYDPSNPLYRYDYWGEPKNSEKSKQERMTDAHNKSIVGKGVVWYEMSYEDAIKERMEREARSKVAKEDDIDQDEDDEDDDDDDDFDFSILRDSVDEFSAQPHVNGTESSRMSDEGMFED